MEAISLALNGRIGERGILEELNPHWFNTEMVDEFLSLRQAGKKPALAVIGAVANGRTLEPQLIIANGEPHMRKMLGITTAANLETWMAREKTEGAIRLAESVEHLSPPDYMKAAAEFIHHA